MRLYHVHLYFNFKDLAAIRELDQKARASNIFHVFELFEKPIGPHPLPTLEFHFHEDRLKEAKTWLTENQNGRSILIHEETGNDVRDHSENIEWLGTPIKLDFDFFELILQRPELRIHPLKS